MRKQEPRTEKPDRDSVSCFLILGVFVSLWLDNHEE